MHRTVGTLLATLVSLATWASVLAGPATAITLTELVTVPNAIGIDFQESSGDLIVSVNWQDGIPFNLVQVGLLDASVSQFSPFTGAKRELKVATQRSSACAQFPLGTVFTANGNPGEIVRINPNGTIFGNPWVDLSLSGETTHLRGAFHVDRACAAGGFGGDLVVVAGGGEALLDGTAPALAETGNVWRVNSAGAATLLATITGPTGTPAHLEGVITLPVNPIYGPFSGKAVVADETNARLCAVDADPVTPFNQATDCFSLEFNGQPVQPEDIELIEADADFFGVEFIRAGESVPDFSAKRQVRILMAPAEDLAPFVGDLLVTMEEPFKIPGTSGLYRVFWNGTGLTAQALGLEDNDDGTAITDPPIQWEHVTLAPRPDAQVDKAAVNATINAGENASFQIVATANGPGPSIDVVVTDIVPAGFLITGGANAADCSIDVNGILTCNFGDLQPGATRDVIISAPTSASQCTGPPSFTISNTATVAADRDRVPSNNESTAEITVNCPDVRVTKDAPTPTIAAGEDAVFVITVTANAAGASNVTLDDTLPNGSLTWSFVGTPPAGCTLVNNQLSCTFATAFGPNESRTITVKATTSAGLCQGQASVQITNPLATVGATGDSNSANNTAGPVSITVNCPGQATCVETVNPAGKNIPPAGNTQHSKQKAQNPDGFYRIGSTTGEPVFVVDLGTGTVFGPFASGTNIKYTEANGATPGMKKQGGPDSAVSPHINGQGDMGVTTDPTGRTGLTICLVPPPPK